MPDYNKLPEPLQGGLQRYIENRIEPGGFLRAVLENDLAGAFGRADILNRARMFEIVSWLYNEAPSICWGSREAVKRWLDKEE